MAKRTITELKNYFKAGKRPTETQFGDVMDSFANLEDPQLFPKNYVEKRLSTEFPHLVADQAVDILLGNRGMSGWLEVEIVGTWMYWNSVGNIKKLFQVGFNPDNGVWYTPTSRIVEAGGLIINHIYIGDLVWDANINQYKITIYHTHYSGNLYDIRITHHCPLDTQDFSEVKLSDIYTNALTGQRVHYIHYNDNLGVGTVLPEARLHVVQNQSSYPIDAMTVDVVSFGTPHNANKSHYFRVRDIGANNHVPFIIKGSGNVGIGTETPAAKMHLVSGYVSPDSEGALIVGDTSQVNLRFGCTDRYSWMQGHGTASLHINPLGNNVILNRDGGNVGVGVENPQSKLEVNGLVTSKISNTSISPANVGGLNINELGNNVFEMSFARDGQGIAAIKTIFDNPIALGTNNIERVRIQANTGNVGIGTKNPDQKLTVKGKIHAEDVIVDMNVPADYVFQKYFDGESSIKPDYQMPTIQELEFFVRENKHLPEIPSGEAIVKDGVSLGDFQMKLLQKIEELTLYVISQNKEIENLKAIIKK